MSKPSVMTFAETRTFKIENLPQMIENDDFPILEFGRLGGSVMWYLMIRMRIDNNEIRLRPVIGNQETPEKLNHRFHIFLTVNNQKDQENHKFVRTYRDVFLKHGYEVMGEFMDLAEVLNPENGWLNENGDMEVMCGIQVDAIQKDKIWRFNFANNYHQCRPREGVITFKMRRRGEGEPEVVVADKKILTFHSSIFNENSGRLRSLPDEFLVGLEECMQIVHGVRMNPVKNFVAVFMIAREFKLWNVMRYLEQKWIESPEVTDFALKKRVVKVMIEMKFKRYLAYSLALVESKEDFVEILKDLDVDVMDGETMKYLVAKFLYDKF